MIIPGIGLLLLLTGLLVWSGKEKLPEECGESSLTKPFYKAGVRIYRLLQERTLGSTNGRKLYQGLFGENEERFRLLLPGEEKEKAAALHFIKKTGLCLLVLTVGIAFALLIGYKEKSEGLLSPENSLVRPDVGKMRYSLELDASVGEENYEDVPITVEPRKYAEGELKAMLPEFHRALEAAFLGENESPDHVERAVHPVEEVEGYPFLIEWQFSDTSVLDRKGAIGEGVSSGGSLVSVTANVSYEDFKESHEFALMVYPEKLSQNERLYKELMEALKQADEESAQQEAFVLPAEEEGIKILWQEKKKDHTAILLLAVMLMSAAVFWAKDRDLEKRVKERDEQMLSDYPELISKLVLYVGAGMTVRSAWKKLAEDGKQTGHYLYEEMMLAVHDMESGCGEIKAYQHFAKRCRVQRYVKMVSLIEQSVKLGARGFLSSLQSEARDALEERKAAAERKGEEAGTKLLLPMMLMLGIVMVVIIVPAFMGMG